MKINNHPINLIKKIFRHDTFIFIICVSGIIFRFAQVFNFAVFDNDQARDLLVVRHIVFFNEPRILGHDASGIPGLFYPPYYYYFLSFITRLFDNPQIIYLIIALLSGASVYFLYLTIKLLFNKNIALYSTIIYIFLPGINRSANLWSCYVGLSFFIISLYFLVSFLKSKKLHKGICFLILSFFSSFTAYEFIMFLPLFTVLMLFAVRNNYRKFFLLTFAWIFLVSVSLIPVINHHIQHFSSSIDNSINYEYFVKSSLNIKKLIFKSVSDESETSRFLLFSEIITLSFLIKLLLVKDIKNNKNLIGLFLVYCYGIIIASFKKNTLDYQLLALWPITFTLILAQVDYIFNRHKIYITLITIYIVLFGFPCWNHVIKIFNFSSRSETNKLIQSNSIAKTILSGIQDDINPFRIYILKKDDKDPYYGLEIYYFLERDQSKKYVTVTKKDEYLSLVTPGKKIDKVFLVCRNYSNTKLIKTQCLNKFIRNFKIPIKIDKEKIIFNQRDAVVYQINLKNHRFYEF